MFAKDPWFRKALAVALVLVVGAVALQLMPAASRLELWWGPVRVLLGR